MSGIIGSAGSKSGVIGTTELDYEEGTFELTISGAAGVGPYGLDSGQRTAMYTKIGRLVTFLWHVGLCSIGSVSGVGTLTGLPFTQSGDEGSFFISSGTPADGNSIGGKIIGTTMHFIDQTSSTATASQWQADATASPNYPRWTVVGTYYTEA